MSKATKIVSSESKKIEETVEVVETAEELSADTTELTTEGVSTMDATKQAIEAFRAQLTSNSDLTDSQILQLLKSRNKPRGAYGKADPRSTSSKILELARLGFSGYSISKSLGIRPQHAYNVIREAKKDGKLA